MKIEGLKLDLYPYQEVGVEFFVKNNGRAILTDTMGLGKTAQSLAYVVRENFGKTLVICPASLKYTWEKEIKKWTHKKCLVIDSKTDLAKELEKDYNIYVINYDILKRFTDILIETKWSILICDEFHYIKNHLAQRTKLVRKIANKIPRLILLSGTPLLSRPIELYNGLNLIDGFTWSNWFGFTRRYCAGFYGRFGYDAKGASNIPELRSKISKYFLRRTKEEVLPDLPAKRFIDLPVDIGSEDRKEYNLIQKNFVEYLREKKNKKDSEIRRSLAAETLVKLNELRMLTSNSKADYALELINNIVDGGEKVVVFSVYNGPLEALKEKLGDSAIMLTGTTNTAKRQEMIDDFQTNPSKKVFLGGMKSAGVGITLTAASNVLFIDYSWVPADHAQAADRIHRIGQEADSVTIYQLYAKDTIDHYMNKLLEKKQLIFDQLIENEEVVVETRKMNLVSDLTKIIEKEYEEFDG